jgi:hypothetical protein
MLQLKFKAASDTLFNYMSHRPAVVLRELQFLCLVA